MKRERKRGEGERKRGGVHVQVKPSPSNPVLQVQLYVLFEGMHVAFTLHVFVSHGLPGAM